MLLAIVPDIRLADCSTTPTLENTQTNEQTNKISIRITKLRINNKNYNIDENANFSVNHKLTLLGNQQNNTK